MNKALQKHLAYVLCIRVNSIRAVSGGDISAAYGITADTEQFFCKVNGSPQGLALFEAEQQGLQALRKTKTISVPKVLWCGTFEGNAILVMEHITAKQASATDLEKLGQQLAVLHQLSAPPTFGFSNANFIGSLPQQNRTHSKWVDFFVQERLVPQFKLARDTQLVTATELPTESKLLKRCEALFPEVQPALLHGDLWSGNYLISENGEPYLIDPSVYYGHAEVDIAMTRLFGGFGQRFYDAYHEIRPEVSGCNERTALYQLYYLLAHLNMFGVSYKNSVLEIVKRYFL
ncbi:fructosamine kinase family protein [Croceivirga lutea]|uniref:fructosamine kinase family protein n=1 Tax=Croceivirga lutea TaxID=1775167 RepID=UPI00163B2AA9|nr:fructosamine kinase family protein [Croceivirga lutea]